MLPIGITIEDLERWLKRAVQAFWRGLGLVLGPWFRRIQAQPLDHSVLELLAQLYLPLEPVRRCGQIYPVLVASQTALRLDRQAQDPVVVPPEKQDWQPQKTEALYDRRPAFRRVRRILGAPVENLPLFRMLRIEGMRIEAQLGRYDHMLETCESLEWELRKRLRHLSKHPPRSPEELLDSLPVRRALHKKVADPATNGEGRCAAISVSVLTVYWHGDSWRLLVRRRSNKGVATDPNRVHVLPSFTLAPEHGAAKDEYTILHNLRREFAEELFGLRAPKDLEYLWFTNADPVRELDAMLESGDAEIWVTGIAVPLLALRPEVCALLWIKNRDWFANRAADDSLPLRVNEEFATHTEAIRSAGGYVPNVWFDPEESDESLQARSGMSPSESVPVGAAAFWLGIDLLRTRLNDERPP